MARNLTFETGSRGILPICYGKNYNDWKGEIETFIRSMDLRLWHIIKNGPEPADIMDETNAEDMNTVTKQDLKAKFILCCAVNFEAYREISSFNTAKEMWDSLENRYGHGNNDVESSSSQQICQSSSRNSKPSDDFFMETREAMDEYLKKCVPLYKYALQGNWKEAKAIIKGDKRLKNAAIAKGCTTVLHIAASAGDGAKQARFVKKLMMKDGFLDKEDLLLQDNNGNTAFCIAAAAGNMRVVSLMKAKNETVVEVRGAHGTMLPVQFAAMQGRCHMASYLYEETKEKLSKRELVQLFFTCINNGIYGLALKMATDHSWLAFERDENSETALHLLARNHLDSCCQSPQHQSHPIMINPAMKQKVVFQLVKKLWSTILEKKYSKLEIIDMVSEPFQVLIAAAEVGNFGFLSELLSAYPCLIWTIDEKNHTIIHKAVMYRHASIFNIIHEIGLPKDIIVTMVDTKGNTLLHLAARRAPQSQLELVSGVAFQMSLELLWFKEVEKVMQPSYIKSKNKKGLTARELFTREHKQLRKEAESWMKSTAEQCMLVATVIATGVFSADINIPTGSANNKLAFMVFAISDAAAFITSVAAILIFLSILLSRYAEYDFYRSLPLKLMFGLVALFCSITSMMVAFASAFFITYKHQHGLNRVPIFISVSAFLPILLFLILQSSLWSDIIYSTIYCRNLFKPSKKVLYLLKNGDDQNKPTYEGSLKY